MENLKPNKGITLVALVVTIIVLIILAGISINLLMGDNGIIKKAQLASTEQEKASLVEEIQLKITDKQIDNNGKISKEQVKDILDEYGTTIIENDEITGLRPENKDYIIPIEKIYTGSTDENVGEDANKSYLLKNTNEYAATTGEWMYMQSPEDNGRCQTYVYNKDNGLYLYGKGGNGKVNQYWYWAARNSYITTNPINLSGYTTLHINGHASSNSSYTVRGNIEFGAISTRSMNSIGCFDGQAEKGIDLVDSSIIEDESLDLTSLDPNQTYYIYVWLNNTYYQTECGFTIEKIWLE